MGEDARLAALPWTNTPLSIAYGPSSGDDLNSVSHAEAGVAETGTLVIVSGSHNPSTLNFLPDNHIVVLRAEAIEATYEDALAKLRQRYGKGADAPHRELDHRPVAFRRYRAKASARRSWPTPLAYRHCESLKAEGTSIPATRFAGEGDSP